MNLLVPPSFYTAADLEYTMSYRDVVQQGSTYTHINTVQILRKIRGSVCWVKVENMEDSRLKIFIHHIYTIIQNITCSEM